MVSQETLDFFFTLLNKESGLSLDRSKTYLIENRLEPIARREGFSSIDDLGRHIKKNLSQALCQKVIYAMMTSETSFFRDLAPFEILKTILIPDLMKANERTKRIKIWSAGCSTGQEPYSIAMLLCEISPLLKEWDVRILATDIAEPLLEIARSGIYSQYEVQRGLPAVYLTRFFIQHGTGWEIKKGVKSLIEFQRLNLVSSFSSLGPFDIIFCRNVLIYLDAHTKKKVLEQIARVLSPMGALFLGGAETTLEITYELVRVQTKEGIYYKKCET